MKISEKIEGLEFITFNGIMYLGRLNGDTINDALEFKSNTDFKDWLLDENINELDTIGIKGLETYIKRSLKKSEKMEINKLNMQFELIKYNSIKRYENKVFYNTK